MENKNESSNSLSSSKKSINDDISEKSKNLQEKPKSDTKSTTTRTEEEEIIDLPSPENIRYEFISKEQWEQEIELYRAYLLDLSSWKEPDIYRLTSEIATVGTLTFRIYKKEIKNCYYEAKFPFDDAFKLFGCTPLKEFPSLTSLYVRLIEFLIQDLHFKLREPISETSDRAVIEFINNRIKPHHKCVFVLRKILVKEKSMDNIIRSKLSEIERNLITLKLQNRIFFELEHQPKVNKHLNYFYNLFKDP